MFKIENLVFRKFFKCVLDLIWILYLVRVRLDFGVMEFIFSGIWKKVVFFIFLEDLRVCFLWFIVRVEVVFFSYYLCIIFYI